MYDCFILQQIHTETRTINEMRSISKREFSYLSLFVVIKLNT